MQSGQELFFDPNQVNSLLSSQLEQQAESKDIGSLTVELPSPSIGATLGEKLADEANSPFPWYEGNLHFNPHKTIQDIATDIYGKALKSQCGMADKLYAENCEYTLAACCVSVIGLISKSGEHRIGVSVSGNNQTTQKAAILLKIFTATVELYNSLSENKNRQAKLLTSPLSDSFMSLISKNDSESSGAPSRMCSETTALSYAYYWMQEKKLSQVIGMSSFGMPIWLQVTELNSSVDVKITRAELLTHCKSTLLKLGQPVDSLKKLEGIDLTIDRVLKQKYALTTKELRHWHKDPVEWFHCKKCNTIKPKIRKLFEDCFAEMKKSSCNLDSNLSPVKNQNGPNMLHLKLEMKAKLNEDENNLKELKKELEAKGIVTKDDNEEACFRKVMALVKGLPKVKKDIKDDKDSKEKKDSKDSKNKKDKKDKKDKKGDVAYEPRSLYMRYIAIYQLVQQTRAQLDALDIIDPYSEDVYNKLKKVLSTAPCFDNRSASSSSASSSSSTSTVSKEQKNKQVPITPKMRNLLGMFNQVALSTVSSSSNSSSSCSSTSSKEQKSKVTKSLTKGNTSHSTSSSSSSSSSSTHTSPSKKVQMASIQARKQKRSSPNSHSNSITSVYSSATQETDSSSSFVSVSATSVFTESLTLFSPLPQSSASTGLNSTTMVSEIMPKLDV